MFMNSLSVGMSRFFSAWALGSYPIKVADRICLAFCLASSNVKIIHLGFVLCDGGIVDKLLGQMNFGHGAPPDLWVMK